MLKAKLHAVSSELCKNQEKFESRLEILKKSSLLDSKVRLFNKLPMVFSLLDSRIFFRKTRRPWTSLHPRQCPARGRSRRLLSRPPKVASGSYSIGSEDGRTNCTVCKLQDHVFRVFVSGKFLFSRMPLWYTLLLDAAVSTAGERPYKDASA